MSEASSGRRGRGRPVSQESRRAALAAAADLLDEAGFRGFTVDEVARRSKVGKATIYKHWSSGFALAVAAHGQRITDAVPVTSTGDAIADIQTLLVDLARFYAGPHGQIVAELLGASVGSPEDSRLIRDEFFGPRRTATAAVIREGQQSGTVRDDLSPDLLIDMVYGALVFRLLNGRGPLRPGEARTVAHALTSALRPPVDTDDTVPRRPRHKVRR